MEPISLLVGLAIAVGTGALSKVGENITDGTVNLSWSLWSVLSHKAPDSQTAILIEAGQDLDYQQAVIDVDAIADDPDVVKSIKDPQQREEVMQYINSGKKVDRGIGRDI